MARSKSVSAIPVKAIAGARSQDGQHGVLLVVREQPDSSGRERLNLVVKTELLPTVAAVCLGLIDPRQNRQGGRRSRALIPTRQMELGIANNGQVALTFRLETNASLSFGLDPSKARNLAEALVEYADQVGGNSRASNSEKAVTASSSASEAPARRPGEVLAPTT